MRRTWEELKSQHLNARRNSEMCCVSSWRAFITGMRAPVRVVLPPVGGGGAAAAVTITQRPDMRPACAQTYLDVRNVPVKLSRPDFGIAARAPASGLCHHHTGSAFVPAPAVTSPHGHPPLRVKASSRFTRLTPPQQQRLQA